MRNRAKCKLCSMVIESFHDSDYVECGCGEISVDGGTCLRCSARRWENFLRIDENDNEIVISVRGDPSSIHKESKEKPGRDELISGLDEMIRTIDNLPDHARYAAVTQAELSSVLSVLLEIIRS